MNTIIMGFTGLLITVLACGPAGAWSHAGVGAYGSASAAGGGSWSASGARGGSASGGGGSWSGEGARGGTASGGGGSWNARGPTAGVRRVGGLVERQGRSRRYGLGWRRLLECPGRLRRLRIRRGRLLDAPAVPLARRPIIRRPIARRPIDTSTTGTTAYYGGTYSSVPSTHHRELLRLLVQQLRGLVHRRRRRGGRRGRRGRRSIRGLGQHRRRHLERLLGGLQRWRGQHRVCHGRDLCDAACRLRRLQPLRHDLLPVRHDVVPAVLRRERRHTTGWYRRRGGRMTSVCSRLCRDIDCIATVP